MDGHDAFAVLERLTASGMEIVPFSSLDAALASSLLPKTKRVGLSLGDRACLALAMARRIPALTADRTWLKLDVDIPIELIR
jgi:PIN domain nuclease of toxin-antitoxin system